MSTATTTVTLARPHIHSLHLRSSSSLSLSPPTTPRMPENLDHRLTPELSATNSNTSTSTSTGSSVASRDSGADSQTKSRLSQTETETWPTAVEALVQRLWECGRDALNRHYSTSPPTSAAPSASGSKLVFDDTEEAGNLGLDAASSLDQHDDTAVDADSLCDGPYVRVDYCSQPESSKLAQDKIIGAVTAPASPSENAQRDVSAAKACGVNGGLDHDSLPARRQQTPHCGRKRQAATCEKKRPALLHYQPMSNPFKTMLRQPMSPQPAASATGAAAAGYAPAIQSFCSSTALSGGSVNNNNNNNNTGISTKQNALQPAIQPLNKGIRLRSSNRIVNPSTSPLATSIAAVKCVHCKKGNFLEFCFSSDRCSCSCHDECPCKPCMDIREQRTLGTAATSPAISPLRMAMPTHAIHAAADYFSPHHTTKVSQVWSSDEPQRQQQGLCSLAS